MDSSSKRDSSFRSQGMCLCQIIMPSDTAFRCVAEMGELEVVHFNDLNSHTTAIDKKFVNEIRVCDDIERQLRFIEKELQKNDIKPILTKDEPPHIESQDLHSLKESIEKIHDELGEVVENSRNLAKSQSELIELKHVLTAVNVHFSQDASDTSTDQTQSREGVEAQQPADSDITPESQQGSAGSQPPSKKRGFSLRSLSIMETIETPSLMSLSFIAGTIDANKLSAFELTIWRTSRGNAFIRQSSIKEAIPDVTTGEPVTKVVFLVFFQGNKLREKIEMICEGFQANVYKCPENQMEIKRFLDDVAVRQIDMSRVMSSTNDHYRHLLLSAAEHLNNAFIQVLKTKSIYYVLNMCRTDVARQSLLTECWIPENDLNRVKLALKAGSSEGDGDVSAILNRKSTSQQPPTSFKTNKLTKGYQALVDAYGIPEYQEMNPVPFSIISFPFLFSIMFGDLGHAIVMSLAAAWMCINERKLSIKWRTSEVLQIFFTGRYIILLMGIFSMYSGIMYNDALSKSANAFGGQWRVDFDFKYMSTNTFVQLEPDPFNRMNQSTWVQMYSGFPYIFGLDPVWALSVNKISFLNSLKMKMSIIIGVSQMTLGLMLHLSNILFFKRKLDIPIDFLPKITFFVCMFFYLVLLIFYKWIRYNGSPDPTSGAACAPALLVHYINMFLFAYGSTECSLQMFYPGQQQVQTALVVIAALCIPVMLIPKPAIEIYHRRKRAHVRSNDSLTASLIDMAADYEASSAADHFGSEPVEQPTEVPISDMIMDHAIETIEFFLNSVSSAASYLRLWALSLAHAELSEVLWTMVMHLAYVAAHNVFLKGVLVYVIFYFWAILTFCILILMEGLSAFLHVLRLHWVEFQSKFYKSSGYAFTPLRLKSIVDKVNLG